MNLSPYIYPEMDVMATALQPRASGVGWSSQPQVTTASEIMQRCSRSFSMAVRFLPARMRDQVIALYAWCRCVDDTVDQSSNEQQADQDLQTLTEDLQRCVLGEPTYHPASAWIEPLLAGRLIDARHARELLEGMRMDLQRFRVVTDNDLQRYCYHAAGTVGLMMARLMGVRERAADRHAIALGIAMQLTNIARDVREDAQRGRSYLPGIEQPLESQADEVKAAVARILSTAEHHYRTAIEGLKYLPWNCRLAIRVALTVYREIGRQIERNGYDVLDKRTVVSQPRLILVASFALLHSLADDALISIASFWNSLTQLSKVLTMNHPSSSPSPLTTSSPVQAKQIVYLGLSLTLIMATALFMMVFVHPKSVEYSFLPLIYAGVCLLGSIVFHRQSARA